MDLVLICVIISYDVNVGNGRQQKPNPGCYCAVAASAPTSHLMGFSPQRKSEVTYYYAEFLIVSTFFSLYSVCMHFMLYWRMFCISFVCCTVTNLVFWLQQTNKVYHGLRGSASPVLTATGFVNGRGQFSTPHRIHTP